MTRRSPPPLGDSLFSYVDFFPSMLRDKALRSHSLTVFIHVDKWIKLHDHKFRFLCRTISHDGLFFLLQIIRKDRPLYIQTSNCVEEKKWVDLLSKICENNKRRLDTFHPCAFINGVWTW